MIGLPLRQTNTSVQYVPTGYENERTRMLKSLSQLEHMDDDNEFVYMTSILDKYAARPFRLNNLCLAEFASMYTYTKSSNTDDSDDEMEELNDVASTKHSY